MGDAVTDVVVWYDQVSTHHNPPPNRVVPRSLLNAAQEGDIVVAASPDRIDRDPEHLQLFLDELRSRGVVLLVAGAGQIAAQPLAVLGDVSRVMHPAVADA
jgi:DNA invertase Pin-like site-specific DNA recombinase